eukprot:CAMPEP_0203674148 /NCGR_PEP_ID=MMETSP0090-20130426/15043_1 /ASSEMBLY_ACC=CAM_ASM_001088 /TAXON_ID=426623 /ORGANISM="Chaetoceros affinis, Strain CCMP159" /LENGTH=322 /DNA_ID=CAMNT_0050539941 /DNA_START=60 /DNA_END=1025 /DNA_ORIENTATION=-
MYAQLHDDANPKVSDIGSSSKTSSSISIASPSNGNGMIKIGPRAKNRNKNLELQKSLMEDDGINGINDSDNDNGDIETGDRVNGNDKKRDIANGSSSLMVSDDDPFYVFKEDLQVKLEMVDDGLERFERIVQITDTAVNTHEVKEVKKQLKRHIKNAESTLKDLQTTVRLVEKNRDDFQNIDDSELGNRKNFILASANRIKLVKTQMNSDSIKSKLLADERAKSKRRLGLLGAKSEEEEEETKFIAKSHASTQLMMQQQDETLDELGDAVVRVGHMAENIHDELGQQNKMLTDLEDDLVNAEEQLGLVMGRLAKMLKTKNKW